MLYWFRLNRLVQQSTLAMLAQWERHESVTHCVTRGVLGSHVQCPLEINVLLNLLCSLIFTLFARIIYFEENLNANSHCTKITSGGCCFTSQQEKLSSYINEINQFKHHTDHNANIYEFTLAFVWFLDTNLTPSCFLISILWNWNNLTIFGKIVRTLGDTPLLNWQKVVVWGFSFRNNILVYINNRRI